jgi:hypothetical protein
MPDPRMLTPAEMAKLPPCRRSWFGTCELGQEPPVDFCLRCMCDGIFEALTHEDIARATEALHTLMDMLEARGIIRKGQKPPC